MLANFHIDRSAATLDANRRMSRAVAVSLLTHFLFLACAPKTLEILGKGGGAGNEPGSRPRAVLAARLAAVSGESVENGGKAPDTGTLDGYSAESSEKTPSAALSQVAPEIEEHRGALPDEGQEPVNPPASQPSLPTDDTVAGDDSFFPRARLTVPPVALMDSAASDPLAAFGERLEPGRYALRLFINREGRVVDVRGAIPPGGGEDDDSIHGQLLAAFASIRFSPARINGLAVNSQIDIEISAIDESPGSSRASDTLFP